MTPLGAEDRQALVQGALAGIVLVGLFAIVIIQLVLGKTPSVPDVVSITVTAVVAYVFGQRGVLSGFHGATNGITALAQANAPIPPPLQPGGTSTTTTTETGPPAAPAARPATPAATTTPGGESHAPQG